MLDSGRGVLPRGGRRTVETLRIWQLSVMRWWSEICAPAALWPVSSTKAVFFFFWKSNLLWGDGLTSLYIKFDDNSLFWRRVWRDPGPTGEPPVRMIGREICVRMRNESRDWPEGW